MQGVRYFKNENFPPLTPKMIATLLSCLELQNKNIPFGQPSVTFRLGGNYGAGGFVRMVL